MSLRPELEGVEMSWMCKYWAGPVRIEVKLKEGLSKLAVNGAWIADD